MHRRGVAAAVAAAAQLVEPFDLVEHVLTMGYLALKRAIRHAEANDLISRNVATLADTPKGQHGRPSKSLTLDQAVAVITTARTLPAGRRGNCGPRS